MTFTRTDKFKALEIVHIFETSRPIGNFAACVVLNDGAGISYGISQFTHRSGSLHAVAKRYLESGGGEGAAVIASRFAALADRSGAAIKRLSADGELKEALRAAAATREMKAAQVDISNELYLKPALAICSKYGFVRPLSLAVIYDSVVHGSFHRVAGTVRISTNDEAAWIAAYVKRRDQWLLSYPRLARTRYRTRFFIEQIEKGNWKLALPLNVNGVLLEAAGEKSTAGDASPSVRAKSSLDDARRIAEQAGAAIDRADAAVTAVKTRADAAKSMWTTVGGTLWQAVWAVFGFFAGLPREVWITVAVIAALLMLAYLYRQIALGRIRERSTG